MTTDKRTKYVRSILRNAELIEHAGGNHHRIDQLIRDLAFKAYGQAYTMKRTGVVLLAEPCPPGEDCDTETDPPP